MGRNKTTQNASQTPAADRLVAVHSEIAELGKPLPPSFDVDADLDALTALVMDRGHRAQALTMIVPALERAALVEQLPALYAATEAARIELIEAGKRLRPVELSYEKAVADLTAARIAESDAGTRYNLINFERYKITDAIRQHDEKHSPTPPPPVKVHASFNPHLVDPFAAV